jgi:hypothetical protein
MSEIGNGGGNGGCESMRGFGKEIGVRRKGHSTEIEIWDSAVSSTACAPAPASVLFCFLLSSSTHYLAVRNLVTLLNCIRAQIKKLVEHSHLTPLSSRLYDPRLLTPNTSGDLGMKYNAGIQVSIIIPCQVILILAAMDFSRLCLKTYDLAYAHNPVSLAVCD